MILYISRAERNPGEGGEEESDEDDLEKERLLEDVVGVVFGDDERLFPLLFRNDKAACQSGRLRVLF